MKSRVIADNFPRKIVLFNLENEPFLPEIEAAAEEFSLTPVRPADLSATLGELVGIAVPRATKTAADPPPVKCLLISGLSREELSRFLATLAAHPWSRSVIKAVLTEANKSYTAAAFLKEVLREHEMMNGGR